MSNLILDAEALYTELLAGVRQLWRPEMVLLGVWSGGAWLAERLAADMGTNPADLPGIGKPGVISSTLHRDDFSERGMHRAPPPPRSRSRWTAPTSC